MKISDEIIIDDDEYVIELKEKLSHNMNFNDELNKNIKNF